MMALALATGTGKNKIRSAKNEKNEGGLNLYTYIIANCRLLFVDKSKNTLS